jgi:lipopolysaccharide/colanic/teichoic acid biosynthesis glycosyltransferase
MMQEQSTLSRYFDQKAWPTRILGAMLLVVASPLILFLVAIVRLTSAGPGFYRQVRTGRHGVDFTMLKIRTMYDNAEFVTGPVWSRPKDSRITPFGKFLRLFHLDELPQLINVVRGEMDLVGPRPERPVFVAELARVIPNYRARLQVLPGITGLAQVNLPPDESYECVRRKLVLDCLYIRNASALLDFRILICTALRLAGIRHGRAVRLLQLDVEAVLPSTWRHATSGNGACHPTSTVLNPVSALTDAEPEQVHPVAVGAVNGYGGSTLGTEQGEFESETTLPARRPR